MASLCIAVLIDDVEGRGHYRLLLWRLGPGLNMGPSLRSRGCLTLAGSGYGPGSSISGVGVPF